jgi:thioredoxin reductase (NADPH)
MEHAKAAGSEMKTEFVTELVECDYGFWIRTQSWNEYEAKKVILATGNKYRKLWIPWEERYLWRWVSYCATCDGMFFRGRELAVVWGWNTAFVEALYLSEIASKVHILYRWDKPKAEKIWQEKAKEKENIEIHLNTEVEEIRWEDFVTNLLLKSGEELKAEGVFVAIWTIPDTKIVDTLPIKKDEEGCIIVDQRQESSIKWLYAAGDVTTNSNKFRQTIMSAAEGCLAANSVHEDIIKEW